MMSSIGVFMMGVLILSIALFSTGVALNNIALIFVGGAAVTTVIVSNYEPER